MLLPLRARQDLRRLVHLLRFRPANAATDPVFVLGTARTGSTLLVDYLNCLPGVHIQGELIHARASVGIHSGVSKARLLTHLQLAMRADPADVRGAKLLLRGMKGRHLSADDLRSVFPDARFIILWRRSVGEQYVSGELAKSTGVWHARHASSRTIENRLHIDRDHLAHWIEQLEKLYRDLLAEQWVLDRSLLVSYEEMVRDPQLLLDGRMAPLLGVDTAPASSAFNKVHDRALHDLVQNYDEVEDLLEYQFDPMQLPYSA